MNENLKQLIEQKIDADGVRQKQWAKIVLAACDGEDAVKAHLASSEPVSGAAKAVSRRTSSGAFLTSLSVEGFRGIGPKQTLTVNPGPGLTVVVGRNGSGKSSFAEALEVLLTGDSKRWSDRSKIWKEGWRNLHRPDPSRIDGELILDGGTSLKISCEWAKDADLSDEKVTVQPKGKAKTSLDELGWSDALISYRPFLSYNELGSMLDEGPSKLYDALSVVLGLEDLVNAQSALSQTRLERQKALDIADQVRESLVAQLQATIAETADERAAGCLNALTSKNWGLTALEQLVGEAAIPSATQETSVLTRALSLDPGDPATIKETVDALRVAGRKLKEAAGSDAEKARQVAELLDAAIRLHSLRGDCDCPVCGSKPGLTAAWADQSRKEIERLRAAAAATDSAYQAAEQARKRANEILQPPPKVLAQLFDIGVNGLDNARKSWDRWHAGASATDLTALADHLESRHEELVRAVDDLKEEAAKELKRREDQWRPIANAIGNWIGPAREARENAECIPAIKEAEKWLKDAAADIRNQRFAPIADKAMATWEHLRQQSSVSLGRIELTGSKGSRRVSLDVTVDGVDGAALGVMSQGELHSLALSLFLPRATLAESPFRFVVIDDPVQSMDPSRVDGLARALEETAKTRQVIVFTHDERLPLAIRRLGVKANIVSVTRRPKSVVEIRPSLNPVKANIEDALALVNTTDLPTPVVRRIVPGYCRAALEASLMESIRKNMFSAGRTQDQIDEALAKGAKLTPLAAIALFDDVERGGEVMARINKFGGWAGDAFKQCNEGAHKEYAGDLMQLIRDTEKLTDRIAAL